MGGWDVPRVAADRMGPAPVRISSLQDDRIMGTSDPRDAATKLGVDRHEARAAVHRILSPLRQVDRAIGRPPMVLGIDTRASLIMR